MAEQYVQESASQEKRCPECGAQVCDVRMPGEDWVTCDWPPLLPVIEFGRAVVANDFNQYCDMVDGEIKPAKYTYDGFKVPGHIASMLMLRHDCKALTEHVTVLSAEGRRRMAGGDG